MANTTMSSKPRIFISAVSSEFKTAREKVSHVLEFLGFEAEQQEIFGTESGDLRQVLQIKIDACEGLLQIVGFGYGAEPPTVDPEYGRVSYTQFEFLCARKKQKKTWLLFAGDTSVRDTPPPLLDLPLDPKQHDRAGYQAERRVLQSAYLDKLRQAEHIRWKYDNDTELENAVLKLRNDSEELRREFRAWQNTVVRRLEDLGGSIKIGNSRSLAVALAAIACIAVLLGGGFWSLRQSGLAELKAIRGLNNARQLSPGTVAVDLGLPAQELTRPPSRDGSSSTRPIVVTYSISRDRGTVSIAPRSAYLDDIMNGRTVSMLPWAPYATPYFEWEYPRLSLKVQNSTSAPCYITEAVIDVVASKLDTTPVLVAEGGFWGHVGIRNEGWGKVINPKARVELADGRGGLVRKELDLPEDLGLDFTKCLTKVDLAKARVAEERRPFSASISYQTEAGSSKTFNCEGTAYFGGPPFPFRRPSREPYDVFLPAGKQAYETILPLSQVVSAGGVDNFEIRIGTDKSSLFDIIVGFRTASGEVIGKTPVRLSTFIARTGRIPGAVPIAKRRRLGESVIIAGVRLTLLNVRMQKVSRYQEFIIMRVQARNEGSHGVWFPAGEDAADGDPYLQFAMLSLEVNGDSHRFKRQESTEYGMEQASFLKSGETKTVDIKFDNPYAEGKQLLLCLRLAGKRVVDEVAFEIPTKLSGDTNP
jgi:Domain of unknown function (DUF4062)